MLSPSFHVLAVYYKDFGCRLATEFYASLRVSFIGFNYRHQDCRQQVSRNSLMHVFPNGGPRATRSLRPDMKLSISYNNYTLI